MTKRRRERDRPKAGPDALYNPNKRVLLSYESDEEAEEQVDTTEDQSLLNRAVASYKTEDIEEENQPQADGVAEALQPDPREDPAETLEEEEEEWVEDEEQPPTNDAALWARGIQKNISTGQWAAIGSLAYQYEDEEGGEEVGSEEEEAMAYLRAVRSERQSMPEFFAAKRAYSSELYDNGIGDTRGYIDDGAYIAAPVNGPTLPEGAKTLVVPQEAFTTALKSRFLKQRQQMHVKSSPAALARLDERHPTSLPKNSNKAYATWVRVLKDSVPQPDQVRSIQQAGVIRILEIIQKRHLQREKDIPPSISAWIWSLLARLDDVGTMDSDRVCSLREFGKKAVLVQLSFRDPEAAAKLEEAAAAESGVRPPNNVGKDRKTFDKSAFEGDSPSQLDATGAERSLVSEANQKVANDESQRTNTMATLDTIIVLVGEIFGQRDLLEFRQSWSEEAASNDEINNIHDAATADTRGSAAEAAC